MPLLAGSAAFRKMPRYRLMNCRTRAGAPWSASACARIAVRPMTGPSLLAVGRALRLGLDSSHRRSQIAQRPRISRKQKRCLAAHPERGIPVVRAANVVVVIPRHIPEHVAQLVELDARHPVRSVTTQAHHPDLGDIGVVNRRDPADLGQCPRIRRTQLDLDPMAFVRMNLTAHPPQALTLHQDKILLRRIALGFEAKNGAFRLKSFKGRQVISQAAHSRRFMYGHCYTVAERPWPGQLPPDASTCRAGRVFMTGKIRPWADRSRAFPHSRPATTSGYTIRWSPFCTPPSTSVQFSSRRRPPSLWSRE